MTKHVFDEFGVCTCYDIYSLKTGRKYLGGGGDKGEKLMCVGLGKCSLVSCTCTEVTNHAGSKHSSVLPNVRCVSKAQHCGSSSTHHVFGVNAAHVIRHVAYPIPDNVAGLPSQILLVIIRSMRLIG